jgi:hypothetical protein
LGGVEGSIILTGHAGGLVPHGEEGFNTQDLYWWINSMHNTMIFSFYLYALSYLVVIHLIQTSGSNGYARKNPLAGIIAFYFPGFSPYSYFINKTFVL